MQQVAKIRFSNLFLLYKFIPKIFTVFAKLLKSAKMVKAGLAGASMVSYSVIFSWKFALILMFMLFVHESGHIWAMKLYGIRTKGIYFLPFVGGAAVAEDAFPSRKAEVVVAIMGPLWGLGLAVITSILFLITGNVFFAAAASWMAMLNLFNLLPINPLDGGRIMKSIVFSINSILGLVFLIIGVLISVFFALVSGYTLFLILLIIGLLELNSEYSARKKLKQQLEEIQAQTKLTNEKIGETYTINLEKHVITSQNNKIDVKPEIVLSKASETNLENINNENNFPKEIPVMSRKAIFASAFAYFLVTITLWLNMELMNEIPGAALALEILKD